MASSDLCKKLHHTKTSGIFDKLELSEAEAKYLTLVQPQELFERRTIKTQGREETAGLGSSVTGWSSWLTGLDGLASAEEALEIPGKLDQQDWK